MEDMMQVCHACLSRDRVLYKSADIQTLLVKIDLQIKDGGAICWECRSMILKFSKFKDQVLETQQTLQNLIKIQELKRLGLAYNKTETVGISSREATTKHGDEIVLASHDENNDMCKESQSENTRQNEDQDKTQEKAHKVKESPSLETANDFNTLNLKITSAECMNDKDASRNEENTQTAVTDLNIKSLSKQHCEKTNENTRNNNETVQDHVETVENIHNSKIDIQDENTDVDNTNDDNLISGDKISSVINEDDTNEVVYSISDDSEKVSMPIKDARDSYDVNQHVINVEEETNSNLPKIMMVQSIEDDDMVVQIDDSEDIIELNIPIPCILIDDDDEEVNQNDLDDNQSIEIVDHADENLNGEKVEVQSFIWNKAIKQEKIDSLELSNSQNDGDIEDETDTTPGFRIEVKGEPLSPEPDVPGRSHELWKKSVLLVYQRLCFHRYASKFMAPITDDIAPLYSTVVKRPMDLRTIARNVRSGRIRSTDEFQRDLYLMIANALMYNSSSHQVHHMAKDFLEEVKYQLEILLTVNENTSLNDLRSPRAKRHAPNESNPIATSTPTKRSKRPISTVLQTCYVKMERSIDLTESSTVYKPVKRRARKSGRIKIEKTGDQSAPIGARRKSCRAKNAPKAANAKNKVDKSNAPKDIVKAKRSYVKRKSVSGNAIEGKDQKAAKTKASTEKSKASKTAKDKSDVKPAKRTYTTRKSVSGEAKDAKEAKTKTTKEEGAVKAAKRTCAARKSCSSVIEAQKAEKLQAKYEKLNDTNATKPKRVYSTRKSCSGVIETKDGGKVKDKSTKTLKLDIGGFTRNLTYTEFTIPLKDKPATKVTKRRRTTGSLVDSTVSDTLNETLIQKPKKGAKQNTNPASESKPKHAKSKKASTMAYANADKLEEMLLNVSTCFKNMTSDEEVESTSKDIDSGVGLKRKRRKSTQYSGFQKTTEPTSKKEKKVKKIVSSKTKSRPTEQKRGRRRKEQTAGYDKDNLCNVNAGSFTDNIVQKSPRRPEYMMTYMMDDNECSAFDKTSLLTPIKKKHASRKIDKNVDKKKIKRKKCKTISTLNQATKTVKETTTVTKKLKFSSTKPKNKETKMKDKLLKIAKIKCEIDTASPSSSDSVAAKIETPSKAAPKELHKDKTIQILSSKIIKTKPLCKDLKLESAKSVLSTKESSNHAHIQDSLCLATAITTDPMRDLTREESTLIKKTLEDTILDICQDAKRFAPKFRGKPIIADGVVKLWCEDYNSLNWLGDIVSKIKIIPDLVVRMQSDLPKKIKCSILLPGNEDFEVIKRLLKAQNPWAMVDSWLCHSIEQRGENMFMVVGIPSTVVPLLLGKKQRLAYSLGSVDVKFCREDGGSCDLPPQNE